MIVSHQSTPKKHQHLGIGLPSSVKPEHVRLSPFDSPNTDDDTSMHSGNTSGQDEFHLERYSQEAKRHRRQDTAGSDLSKRAKPDLNIITNFSAPKMPMKAAMVVVNEVSSKQVGRDRSKSVVSQKAVPDLSTPADPSKQKNTFVTLADLVAGVKQKRKPQQTKPKQNLSPEVQRIPIGITVPEHEAEAVRRNMDPDSAFPNNTPGTPAIIITPADPEQPGMNYLHHSTKDRRPASSIYSAAPSHPCIPPISEMPTPPIPARYARVGKEEEPQIPGSVAMTNGSWTDQEVDDGQTFAGQQRRMSQGSVDNALHSGITESGRPKSQGWWNLVLSPLLRAGSVMSKKGRQETPTSPMPPMPDPSPTVSSLTGPSPDTPRRQGLASARASTWSRWTEWEKEREANEPKTRDLQRDDAAVDQDLGLDTDNQPRTIQPPARVGLAAEYFHACAVELVTGKPYFECEGHSCAEKWPKFKSIHDDKTDKPVILGSPFADGRDLPKSLGEEEKDQAPVATANITSPGTVTDRDELSPNELSPNVRQANTAAFVKARTLDYSKASDTNRADALKKLESGNFQETESTPLPTYVAPRQAVEMPNIAALAYPEQPKAAPAVVDSPSPFSPEAQRSLAPAGAMPMEKIQQVRAAEPAPIAANERQLPPSGLPQRPGFITHQTSYPDPPERGKAAPVTINDLQKETDARVDIENKRQRLEREDAVGQKVGGLWRGRGCLPKNGCFGRPGREGRTKRRWIVAISLTLLAVIITSIVLAVTLTRHGDGTPIQSQWLNLTGFPPIPTGISTIAAPNLAESQNQCTAPTTMWSCSVSKEARKTIGSNEADQPNFRFEIRFRNGTVPANLTIPKSESQTTPNRLVRKANDPFTNDLFVPSPTPPNQPDQIFLGNTTDNITAPFDGEKTPFFISFISTFPVIPSAFNSSGSTKRATLDARQASNASLLGSVPAPSMLSDGSPSPANLLPSDPFPVSQPLRLYNRGLEDEHYGFYIYYDKTIFLSGFRISNESTPVSGSDEAVDNDRDGGSDKDQARSVCTWSETRFLVRMYTNPSFSGKLLTSVSPDPLASNQPIDNSGKKNASESSATNFNRPGSFPYPTSIIIDRHGGDLDKKAVYCYALNQDDGKVNKDEKVFVGELRSFGGQLINAAPTAGSDLDAFDQKAGGIDGGTGGCGCTWQNFE